MGCSLDKAEKKALKRQWESGERELARKSLPLTPAHLEALFAWLSTRFPVEGCDDTLRLTKRWADENASDFDRLSEWLQETGGFCDCEALANSEQAFQRAIKPTGRIKP